MSGASGILTRPSLPVTVSQAVQQAFSFFWTANNPVAAPLDAAAVLQLRRASDEVEPEGGFPHRWLAGKRAATSKEAAASERGGTKHGAKRRRLSMSSGTGFSSGRLVDSGCRSIGSLRNM